MDRNLPTSATPGAVTGDDYMDAVAQKNTQLHDVATFDLINIAGTPNAITADVDPALTAGLLSGMSFWLRPTANNTGAATIDIGGSGPVNVLDDDGNAIAADILRADRLALLKVVAGHIRVIATANIQKVNNRQIFTADGTWNKPAGTPDEALVLIEVISGGGGGAAQSAGSASGGGGGGGYVKRFMRASDVSSSVAVVIGAGGTPGNAGGQSSFGSYVVCYGGGRGNGGSGGPRAGGGGGGGGALRAGADGTTVDTNKALPGDPTGGLGGEGLSGGLGVGDTGNNGGDGSDGGGGGGGSGRGTTTAVRGGNGGASINGGGGGGGYANFQSTGSGGVSLYAGNGGAWGVAGQAPGGGGGANAAGARGEVRIHVIG